MNGTTPSEHHHSDPYLGEHCVRLSFTPEVEREFQRLRDTIQEEYRSERRQILLMTATVLAGLAVTAVVLLERMGPPIIP